MKKVLALVLAISVIAAMALIPVNAEEFYSTRDAWTAGEKQGETVWNWQNASIGKDDYQDLDLYVMFEEEKANAADAGWWSGKSRNWGQGSFPNRNDLVQPGDAKDVAYVFTAPRDGDITIAGKTIRMNGGMGVADVCDGVRIKIIHNETQIHPAKGWANVTCDKEYSYEDIDLTVKKGDKIYFRVNKRDNGNADSAVWPIEISYAPEAAKTDDEIIAEKLAGAVVMKLNSTTALVDNAVKTLDVPAQTIDDRTVLPVRFLGESLGATVGWDEATSTASLKTDKYDIQIVLGESKFTVDGKEVALDVPAQTINDRTMLPLRAIAEAMGKKVFWDGTNGNDLIIVSDIDNIFVPATDAALITKIVEKVK